MDLNQTKSTKKIKKTPKQILVFLGINLVAIVLLLFFTLWWQNDTSFLAFADGIWFVFAFQLTMAWASDGKQQPPLILGGDKCELIAVPGGC